MTETQIAVYFTLAYLANGIGYACVVSTVANVHATKELVGDFGDDITRALLWPIFVLMSVISCIVRATRWN